MLSISASDEQVKQLERWVKAGSTPQSIALRSLIILEAHRGKSDKAIGKSLKTSQPTLPALEAALRAGRATGFDPGRSGPGPQAAD